MIEISLYKPKFLLFYFIDVLGTISINPFSVSLYSGANIGHKLQQTVDMNSYNKQHNFSKHIPFNCTVMSVLGNFCIYKHKINN